MNRIFKSIWNKARGQIVVVNEASGCGQSRGSVSRQPASALCRPSLFRLTAVAAVVASISSVAFALPSWQSLTGIADAEWSTEMENGVNYANDSEDAVISSDISFGNLAVGRRGETKVYGSSIPWESSSTGYAAAPGGDLSKGGNLTIKGTAVN